MPQELGTKFHEMHDKITIHIEKITQDLQGCFGFYRNMQRQKKIAALTDILKYFNQQMNHFDVVDGFYSCLTNYDKNDLFASIGKSQTQEIAEELTQLCRQARFYGLITGSGVSFGEKQHHTSQHAAMS